MTEFESLTQKSEIAGLHLTLREQPIFLEIRQ